eukprot:4537125-Lingulodinium_polyedra.AAC.1
MAQGWRFLGSGFSIEPEQRYTERGVAFLGCTIEQTSLKLIGRQMATDIAYNMEKFINSCVDAYKELAHVSDLK